MNNDLSSIEYYELKIPDKLKNNFDDYEKLEISDYEKKILLDLRKYSDNNGVEAIKVIYEGGETEICSNQLYGKVKIPNDVIGKKHIRIYHSHTDVSAMSMADMIKLTDANVDAVVLINKAYYVYVIEAVDSHRPAINEFTILYNQVNNEVINDLIDNEYGKITMSELNYMYVQEIMYRICRHYKWKIQGGKIDE